MREPRHLARYLGSWEPFTWTFDPADAAGIDKRTAQMIGAVAAVEQTAAIEANKVRVAGLTGARDIRAFLPVWLEDELEHGRALSAIASALGTTYDDPPVASPLERARDQLALASLRLSRVLPGIDLAFLATGSAAEALTYEVYRELARRTSGTVKATMAGVGRQEGRHLAFYLSAARERAGRTGPAGRYVARTVLSRLWRPVGIERLGSSRWVDVFRPLWEQKSFIDRMLHIDQTIDRIPGLEGLHLMLSFLQRAEIRGTRP